MFSKEIFGEKSHEVIDDQESFRKLQWKNTSLNKTNLLNQDISKIEELELEVLSEKNKNNDILGEELTDGIIDTLDVQSLRSILKKKCKIIKNFDEKFQVLNKNFTDSLKEEQEKNDELQTIIKLQKNEIKKYYNQIIDLKKEITIFREKENIKKSEFAILNRNSNYFMTIREKNEVKLLIKDEQDTKILENEFSGDSAVSFSSNIDNNQISKKWFFHEKKLTINLDDMVINLSKLNDLNSKKMNFLQQNEFKFIDVQMCNFSDSTLTMSKLELDSTES